MIDIATILFTTLLALYVCYRATKLDRLLPWFETRSMFEREKLRVAATKERQTGKAVSVVAPGVPGQDAWRAGEARKLDPYSAAQRAGDRRRR